MEKNMNFDKSCHQNINIQKEIDFQRELQNLINNEK